MFSLLMSMRDHFSAGIVHHLVYLGAISGVVDHKSCILSAVLLTQLESLEG